MKWAWKIGRIAGIELQLHATFLLLIGWIAVYQFIHSQSWRESAEAALFTATVFGIVVLHELGHALMARRFGIRTQNIILLPMGGVAQLDRIPRNPKQEFLIAIAGPAVNVVLAATLALVILIGGDATGLTQFHFAPQHFLSNLLWINITLAVFNMLPAFPMDGGRVLRAFLASRMDYNRATQIAARIGQMAGWIFGLIGLLGNPFLVFIGLFVWMGANAEATIANINSILSQTPVSELMRLRFRTLHPADSLRTAVKELLESGQNSFPVVENGAVLGILTEEDIELALRQQGETSSIAAVIARQFPTCSPTESAQVVFQRMTEKNVSVALVIEGQVPVGLLTTSAILKFVRLHSAALLFSNRSRRKNPFGGPPKSWAEEHAFATRL